MFFVKHSPFQTSESWSFAAKATTGAMALSSPVSSSSALSAVNSPFSNSSILSRSRGDAKANRQMLAACGCPIVRELPDDANLATLVIDAVLGTGLTGPAKGHALEGIRLINNGFPLAKKVAVDIPSGLPSDAPSAPASMSEADITVTFTARQTQSVPLAQL